MNHGRGMAARALGMAAAMVAAACLPAVAGAQAQKPAAASAPAGASAYRSPVDAAAVSDPLAAKQPLLALAEAGRRLVAVGLRGQAVYSDDAGKTWVQAKVPVEVDLVAVNFSTPTHGWAVGHRGVLLETQDAGATWVRKLGGQQLNELIVRHYKALQPAAASAAGRALDAAGRAIQDNSIPSLLDVWFDTPTSGTIVGSFNTILRTEDAGVTWTPVMELTDNPEDLNFFAIRGDAKGLYITGEKGSVWRFDPADKRWRAVPTGYAGTLFGLVVDGPRVVAFGMRGSVFNSEDGGKRWQPVATQRKTGLIAGIRLRNGEILLADQTGELLRSSDAGRSFNAIGGRTRVLTFALLQGADGQLVSAGPGGVGTVSIPAQ